MLRATLMGFIAPRSGGLLTAMMRDVPGSYDCEASCIGGLPIEIGWAFIDTATGEIQSESHLVARRLDHKTLEAMRERAVRQVQEGESPEVVARVLGLDRSTVYGWLAHYRRGGWGALKAKPLFGRPPNWMAVR